MDTRCPWWLVCLLVVPLAVACGDPDSEPARVDGTAPPAAGPSADPPASTAPRTDSGPRSPGETGGQTVEEAESAGVLTGDFDMLLTGPHRTRQDDEGCIEFTVSAENVGHLDDTYRFTVDDGVVEPESAAVAAGDDEDVVATVCDLDDRSVTLDAYSEGRGDRLVDQMSLP